MKRTTILLPALLAAAILGTGQAKAQSIWSSAQVDVKIYKSFSAYAEAEYRTFEGLTGSSRWSGALGLEYKPNSYLKTTVGYSYLHDHEEEEITQKGNIISSYWQPRHRVFGAITGSYRWDSGLKLSLRERYQYTCNREVTVGKTDENGAPKADEVIPAKDKQVLRSRFQMEYEFSRSGLEPYLSVEMYNRLTEQMAVDKMRYTAGISYPITKMHSIKIYYMFEDIAKAGRQDHHVIGIGYKLKIKPKKK